MHHLLCKQFFFFLGGGGFSFQVESKILLCSPQVKVFKLQPCHHYTIIYITCPYGKFGFENVWLNVNYMGCGSL